MKSSGLADSPLFTKRKIKEIKQPCHQVTTTSRNQETMISAINLSILEVGKEATTYRLSKSEKKALIEIIYRYRIRNIRITENEITRIAINNLIEDYKKNKKQSILAMIVDNSHLIL